MAMWSVGGVLCLACMVNSSAWIRLSAKEDHVRHECEHHVPDADKVHYTYLGEPTSVVKKRSIDRSIRIHIYYDPETIPYLPALFRDLITTELIPNSMEYFRKTIKVRSVTTPIRLLRTCKSQMLIYVAETPIPYCVGPCDDTTKCGLVKVPQEHLTLPGVACSICQACYMKQGERYVNVSRAGAGVDTDFILYVSAKQTSRCRPTLIAYASYCQLERALDRPVAGYINICPHSAVLGEAEHMRLGVLSTIKHEILHALGFSSSLFAYYRDQNGDPMSPRMSVSGQPYINKCVSVYITVMLVVVLHMFCSSHTVWSSNITRDFIRRGWKKVTMVVTPAVVREARRHFGCDSLEGAELEDQGGSGTAGSHWEKRVFENEAMTGTLTYSPIFSRVTLALMEDTGWYVVNYSMAETLPFGFQKGCDFVKKSCRDYMQTKKNAGESISPYCDLVGAAHQNKLTCTVGHTSVAVCNLQKYNGKLENTYQPFTHMEGVEAADVPKYGGGVRLADYCPFTQPYMEKSAFGGTRTSQCAFIDNKIEEKFNYLRETFGDSSICLRHKGTWSLQVVGKGQKLYPRRYGAGCYKVACGSRESDGFVVYVDNTTYKCDKEDQELTVSSLVRQRVHTGVIVCPSFREACMRRNVLHYYADDNEKKVLPKYKTASGVSPWSVSWTLGAVTVTIQVIWSHHL